VNNMLYKVLGRTGYKVSIVTIGGCGPGFTNTVDEAVKAFEQALKEGLNMVDIAPSYGNAETYLGPIIRRYRSRLVIAEKTLERTKEGAWRELKTSLQRLGAKYFDIYQFHAVNKFEELEEIMGEGGALEAFLEAREQGLIKYIGLTAHADMRLVVKALEQFDFDTILIPVYAAALTSPAPENDFRPVLKIAEDRDIGVIAIKSIARRRWKTDNRSFNTWYEPFTEQEDIDRAVWFTLSQIPVVTYSMACDVRLWPKIIHAAKRLKVLDPDEQEEVVRHFKSKGAEPLFPHKE